jgi:hypothetical protein
MARVLSLESANNETALVGCPNLLVRGLQNTGRSNALETARCGQPAIPEYVSFNSYSSRPMTDKKIDKRNQSGKPSDTDASLQNELSREAAEGADSIGDVASNRTVSGSSSWETLPDGSAGDGRTPKSGKKSGQSPPTPSRGKKTR